MIMPVIVPDDVKGVSMNISLLRDDPREWSYAEDFSILDNVERKVYLTQSDMSGEMARLENVDPSAVEFHAGENIVEMHLHSLKITHDVSSMRF